MILDFTGVGILLGFLATAIMLLFYSFLVFLVCLLKKRKNLKPLREQNVYKFARAALIFFAINVIGFVLSFLLVRHFPYEIKKSLDGFMILGWLPVNLLAVYLTAPIIQRKIEAIKI